MTAWALVAVAGVHRLAAISPGPSFVPAGKTAAAEGLRPAIGLAAGFGFGAFLWGLAAIAGLPVLFDVAPLLLEVAGGAVLVWRAIHMWRHAPEPIPAPESGRAPRRRLPAIRPGALAMLANPRPAAFSGAVFVGLVPATSLPQAKAIVRLDVPIVEAVRFAIVARAFALPRARAAYGRVKTRLDRSVSVAPGALGLRLALP